MCEVRVFVCCACVCICLFCTLRLHACGLVSRNWQGFDWKQQLQGYFRRYYKQCSAKFHGLHRSGQCGRYQGAQVSPLLARSLSL
jgi:hypothetical protein